MRKLGKNQQALVNELATGKVIRHIQDHRYMTHSFTLEDEDGSNTYMDIPQPLLYSLHKRGLLTNEEEYQSLEVEVYVSRLKNCSHETITHQ